MNIISMVAEFAKDRKVTRVAIEIGALSAVVPDAIKFCFDVCAEGTVAEGAILEITVVNGVGKCCECGGDVEMTAPVGVKCKCGSSRIQCLSGTDLRLKEMEVS